MTAEYDKGESLAPDREDFKGDTTIPSEISKAAQPGTGQTAETVGVSRANQPGAGTPASDFDKGDASGDDGRPKQATSFGQGTAGDGRPSGGSGTGSGDGRPT